jgi:hypothetical protein
VPAGLNHASPLPFGGPAIASSANIAAAVVETVARELGVPAEAFRAVAEPGRA